MSNDNSLPWGFEDETNARLAREEFEKVLERACPEYIRPETVQRDNIRACDALCRAYPTSEISAETLLWHPDWGNYNEKTKS